MRPGETDAIEIHQLRRVFERRVGWRAPRVTREALTGIDLRVRAGTTFGIVGRNGAGKTTTVKILSTLLLPTSGSVRVAGHDVVREAKRVRALLGVVLGGDRGFYQRLTGRENLRFFGSLVGVSGRRLHDRVAALTEQLDLTFLDERVEACSRGMKQRLHLARALLHEPPILILDEPSLGLDPVAAAQMRALVHSLVPRHTVLLTTHDLFEAERLCDEIAVMRRGAVAAAGTPEELAVQADLRHRVSAVVDGGSPAEVTDRVRSVLDVTSIEASDAGDGRVRLTLTHRGAGTGVQDTTAALVALGLRVEEIRVIPPDLEATFFALVGA
ncbi:ABC transporter ATP-binding protein [Micromonospora sp. NPDC051141]|uniref:ABC transporter ATP-binding protein n=1 Tax=Micromonospora sp. NPDC051141 TaxID=3364284 RepID=UPI0037B06901